MPDWGGSSGLSLVQLPPSLEFDSQVAGTFFDLIRKLHAGAVVCEPRHASWFTPQANNLLIEHHIDALPQTQPVWTWLQSRADGWAQAAPAGVRQARTRMVDLGTLEGAGSSFGNAINGSGQVTGRSDVSTRRSHAFLWDGTTMLDLNALIDPADPLQPFVTLVNGVDINDRGQILVNGFDSRFGGRVYVLTPVSVTESGTLALLGLGLLGLGLTRRRAN